MTVHGISGSAHDSSRPQQIINQLSEKHFTMYNVEDGRNEPGDTWDIGLRDLSEYYFAPLKACIEKAQVGAFMCTSICPSPAGQHFAC